MDLFFRNPHVLLAPLRDGFTYAKNPLISNGEQVLNEFQTLVFSEVRQGTTAKSIAAKVRIPAESAELALRALAKSQLVSTTSIFSPPQPSRAGEALSLWVHTSNTCNLSCSYCYVHAQKRGPRMSEETLIKLKENILSRTRTDELKMVTLKIAGGEPLLTFKQWRKHVADIRKALNERGVEVHLHLLTNGTALTKEVLSYLLQHRVAVGLSVDGIYETHDATRSFRSGNGSFSVVEKSLARLLDAKIRPYVTTVVSPYNLRDLPRLTKWLVDRNLGFRYSLQKGGSLDRPAVVATLGRCYEVIERSLPHYTEFLAHTLCDLSFTKPIAETACGVGRTRASVNVDGSIHTCQTEHDQEPLGHILEERSLIDQIISSPRRSSLLSIHDDCTKCPYRYLCAGGCPTYKVNSKSPYCQTFHDLIPTILRLRGLTMLQELGAVN